MCHNNLSNFEVMQSGFKYYAKRR